MKSSFTSLAYLPLLLCACFSIGCAADRRACHEDRNGERVEVPCRDVPDPQVGAHLSPSEARAPNGGCQTPEDCNRVVPFNPPPPRGDLTAPPRPSAEQRIVAPSPASPRTP